MTTVHEKQDKNDQVRPSTTKYDQVRPSTTKYEQVRASTTKYNQVQTKYDQVWLNWRLDWRTDKNLHKRTRKLFEFSKSYQSVKLRQNLDFCLLWRQMAHKRNSYAIQRLFCFYLNNWPDLTQMASKEVFLYDIHKAYLRNYCFTLQ